MSEPRFIAEHGAVVLVGLGRPVRLQDHQVEMLLDIYVEASAHSRFHALYDCHLAVGGVERVASQMPQPTTFRAAKTEWPATPDFGLIADLHAGA